MRLERLLNELIEKYGNNKGYPTPTISWSENNMIDRYGEYNYHANHILVSRLLNTDTISDEYLSYIIFHELTHQIASEHNELFYSRMSVLNEPNDFEKVLRNHMDNCELLSVKKQPIQLGFEETLFVKVSFDKEDPFTCFNNIFSVGNNVVVNFMRGVPKELSNKTICQIIFIVELEGNYYSIGWAKNVKICKQHRYIDYSDIGIYDLEFDCVFKNNKKYFVCPNNAIYVGNKIEFDNSLSSKGYLFANKIDEQIFREIVYTINSYDREEELFGISEKAIKSLAPIDVSTEELESIIKNESSEYRKILLLNKLITIKPSYDSYIARAEAFTNMDYYDYAIDDCEKAKSYLSNNDECVAEMIKKNQIALDRFIKAIEG